MTDNKNLAIWGKVSETDIAHTKQVNQRGGYTSIDATYQNMKATELFGPYGQGWGLESIDYDFSILEQTKMVMCKAVFFYVLDGQRNSFPLNNAINPMPETKQGPKSDEDFCKKLETNTISKALSRLGFSADIFMGKFEDADYIAQIKTAQDIEKAEDREQEVVAKRKEAGEYVKRHIDLILAAASVSEVNGIQKATIRHLERQKLIREIADICDAGIKKIGIESENKKLLITGAKQ